MTNMAQEDKFAGARSQAKAQYEFILSMVQDLDTDDEEATRERIQEDALSVCVRSAWCMPGSQEYNTPAEYELLLCTGGPAVRIMGDLSEHCEPTTARLEMQDWGLVWTGYYDDVDQDVLLRYARCFYFGG